MRAPAYMSVAACLAAACSFAPGSLVDGIDASLGVDANGVIDSGAPDTPQIDAAVDQCPGGSTALALSLTPTLFAAPSGASDFASSCPNVQSAPETFFRVDVPSVVATDLVVDLDDTSMDAVLDVNTNCAGSAPAGEICVDHSSAHGEVIVIPNVPAGRRYVVVDVFNGAVVPQAFNLRAFTRPVRAVTQGCDPNLEMSRCSDGLYCIVPAIAASPDPVCVLPGAGIAQVNELEPNGNCAAADTVTGDSVYVATTAQQDDEDWIALTSAADFRARVTVYTANGACTNDFLLQLQSGSNCASVSAVQTDDDSGLGACPRLTTANLDRTRTNVLRVRSKFGPPPAGGSAQYFVVIDYLPTN